VLSKCANPVCSAPFRYLHEGKLFRMEMESGGHNATGLGADPELRKPGRRVEFFWLCDQCASRMTLSIAGGTRVTTKPLLVVRKAAS
jgi:hypothetical protein